MKYIYLSSLMIALSAFFLIGCENAEYKAQSNSLYITDAAGTNNATTVTMDDGAERCCAFSSKSYGRCGSGNPVLS